MIVQRDPLTGTNHSLLQGRFFKHNAGEGPLPLS
jgi:hypothetical protein